MATALLAAVLPSAGAVGVSSDPPGSGSSQGSEAWSCQSHDCHYHNSGTWIANGCEVRSGWEDYDDPPGEHTWSYTYVSLCVLGAAACNILQSSTTFSTQDRYYLDAQPATVVDTGAQRLYVDQVNARPMDTQGEATSFTLYCTG